MKINNIAFDLDGTLIDLYSIFYEMMAEDGHRIARHNSHRIETNPPLSNAKIWEYFRRAYKVMPEPLPGAQELVSALYEESGHPVKIITARPFDAATDTYEVVKKLFDVPTELVLVRGGEHKAMHLRGIDYFVEDRRKIAIDLVANHNKGVYVPARHYNVVPPDEAPDCFWYISEVVELIPMVSNFVKEVIG